MQELQKERAMGSIGKEVDREIRLIDLGDFEARKAEITEQVWSAATEIGFFQVKNHSIPAQHIDDAFARSAAFFELPLETKQQYKIENNAGYEYMSQVRPSTGTKDRKESYQITTSRMAGKWAQELPGFERECKQFERECWELGMKLMSCFAAKLGFEHDFFTVAHDPQAAGYQSTLRLIHYLPMTKEEVDPSVWRAGAHTDFDVLTLLFQRNGQGGLQVCPGRDYEGQEWTSVTPSDYTITCNIGDMLMRWSDDKLPSNFHRVRSPRVDEYLGSRYSIAFFCQANEDVVIAGPEGKYAPITAKEYIQQRIQANYAKLQASQAVSE